ncbi:MAG: hypothetical protein LAC69_08430 [Chlorobium sp.]|nr:hypothetical protein [Chlorobium sp.]
MESKIIKSLIVLGVPGVALGVFYLLLKSFNFRFSEIGGTFSALIAILFLLIVGGIVFYALHQWAPHLEKEPVVGEIQKETSKYPTKLTYEFKGFIGNLKEKNSKEFNEIIIKSRLNDTNIPEIIDRLSRKKIIEWVSIIDDEILLLAVAFVKEMKSNRGGLGVTQSWISDHSHPLGVGRSVNKLIDDLNSVGLLAPSTEEIPKGTYHEKDALRNPSWDYGNILFDIEFYLRLALEKGVFKNYA